MSPTAGFAVCHRETCRMFGQPATIWIFCRDDDEQCVLIMPPLLYLKMSVIPKLRGHHLICLHFFNGKGYNREFTKNLRCVLEKSERLGVKVSAGADDVCKLCPYMRHKKCCSEDHSNQEIIEMDEFALKLLKQALNIKSEWNALKEKIPAIFHLWLERYCKRCCWANACEENLYYLRLRDGKDTF